MFKKTTKQNKTNFLEGTLKIISSGPFVLQDKVHETRKRLMKQQQQNPNSPKMAQRVEVWETGSSALGHFHSCRTALSAAVTTLYIRSSGLTHLVAECAPLYQPLPIFPTPQPLATLSYSVSMSSYICVSVIYMSFLK